LNTDTLLIVLSAAVLLSYWLGHVGHRLRVPPVVFLLLVGLAGRQVADRLDLSWAAPAALLPLLGTLGLILIVLEGALDLRLDRGHVPVIGRTLLAAGLGLVLMTGAVGVTVHLLLGIDWLPALLIGVPFAVISSAVAIPSAAGLPPEQREFVVYESSLSDILGVMLFNALLVATEHGGSFTGNLVWGTVAVLVTGIVVGLAMYILVGHLRDHVKFAPLLFGLTGVYGLAKLLHLSPLMIVLVLGLILNNPQLVRRIRLPAGWHSDNYLQELDKLKQMTVEVTFVVRTLFFLLLGYSTPVSTLLEPMAWAVAVGLVAAVFALRWLILALCARRFPRRPLVWLGPRGLITVLLYFSLPASAQVRGLPEGALMLVVLLSCIVMAVGLRRDTAGKLPAAPDTGTGGPDAATAAGPDTGPPVTARDAADAAPATAPDTAADTPAAR